MTGQSGPAAPEGRRQRGPRTAWREAAARGPGEPELRHRGGKGLVRGGLPHSCEARGGAALGPEAVLWALWPRRWGDPVEPRHQQGPTPRTPPHLWVPGLAFSLPSLPAPRTPARQGKGLLITGVSSGVVPTPGLRDVTIPRSPPP